MSCTV